MHEKPLHVLWTLSYVDTTHAPAGQRPSPDSSFSQQTHLSPYNNVSIFHPTVPHLRSLAERAFGRQVGRCETETDSPLFRKGKHACPGHVMLSEWTREAGCQSVPACRRQLTYAARVLENCVVRVARGMKCVVQQVVTPACPGLEDTSTGGGGGGGGGRRRSRPSLLSCSCCWQARPLAAAAHG